MSLMLRMAALAKPTVAGVTYATWNPSDKGPSISLSGGNLSASMTGTFVELCRATIGKASGKWYWEIVGCADVGPIQGVATTAPPANSSWPGGDTTSYGWYFAGSLYNNGAPVASPGGYNSTDVLGYALDATAGTLKLYKNNTLLLTQTIGAGTWYPAVGNSGGGGAVTAVANFGASPMVYSPPAGYNTGLY